MGTAIQNRNRLPKKSRWPKSFSTCHEADGRSKMRRKRSDQRADREAEARAPETPAIIATTAQRPWRGNDERQWRLKRRVAPSLVQNQGRNRVLVQRSDHAPARGDQDLGQRRDRALRAAKRDPALALRSALAPAPRSALAPDAALNRAAEANRREGLRRDQRDQRARESAK